MAEQRQRVDEFLDLYKQLEDLLEELIAKLLAAREGV